MLFFSLFNITLFFSSSHRTDGCNEDIPSAYVKMEGDDIFYNSAASSAASFGLLAVAAVVVANMR